MEIIFLALEPWAGALCSSYITIFICHKWVGTSPFYVSIHVAFNSVVVGLPYSFISDSSLWWLFYSLVVILMWLCEEVSRVYLCCRPDWKFCFLYSLACWFRVFWFPISGVSNLGPTSCMWPRTAMNVVQQKIISLLKTLLSFITKFYYLDVYIFCNYDYKLGTCSMILKDYWKGCCIINLGYYVRTFFFICGGRYSKKYAFFFSSVFVSVCVFNG